MKGSSSGGPRYDLKILAQSGGVWTPSFDLTPASVRSALGWGSYGSSSICSVGNPDGFITTTGRVWIAFLVQNPPSSGCTTGTYAGTGPNNGTYYDVWACSLPASFTAANMTTTNCPFQLKKQ